jgi:hypothetical protein
VSTENPDMLDYLALRPRQEPPINLPAALSIACGLAAIMFMLTVCAGVWASLLPMLNHFAGLIAFALALTAVICGGIGALRAPKDSGWYNLALLGYAAGMLVGTLSPIFFLL